MDRQWYFLASRPTNSASPWVVGGTGWKQISVTPGTGPPGGRRCCLVRVAGLAGLGIFIRCPYLAASPRAHVREYQPPTNPPDAEDRYVVLRR
jgi:hypothetical protein